MRINQKFAPVPTSHIHSSKVGAGALFPTEKYRIGCG
jgi:hypothetical protein